MSGAVSAMTLDPDAARLALAQWGARALTAFPLGPTRIMEGLGAIAS